MSRKYLQALNQNLRMKDNPRKESQYMSSQCQFCAKSQMSRISNTAKKPWDEILFETENFIAFPAIGSLVEGWILIAPKKHYICFGSMDYFLFEELDSFLKIVTTNLEHTYGALALFEHGPIKPKQRVGCTVDHAHLHIVPTEFSLREGANIYLGKKNENWKTCRGISDTKGPFKSGSQYLYLEQPLGNAQILSSHDLPSQLFRKVIAKYLGDERIYDWRSFAFEFKAKNTVRKLTYKPTYILKQST